MPEPRCWLSVKIMGVSQSSVVTKYATIAFLTKAMEYAMIP